MAKSDLPSEIKKASMAFTLFCFLILAIYSNTFHAAWQFDDKPNIVDNHHLHLQDLRPQSLVKTFFTDPNNPRQIGNKLYRPIPCLTFALNWYFGKDSVRGYHIINLAIHVLTAFLLFLLILNLLKTPNFRNKLAGSPYFIALLASALWAVNPIQTQAVTYIVQRMASMAALFYVLSMFFYVRCRLSGSSPQRILLLLGCVLAFLFALGSKENTITLPAALLLIEVVGFQNLRLRHTKKVFLGAAIAAGLLLLILGVWLFIPDRHSAFTAGYDQRPFTLAQRLLTEPRIVLFYLSLIFYPIPARLSIEHDVSISTSLVQPWTTLPAVLLTVVLIAIGFSQLRKRPLIALAILFFYLTHLVESSIVPLELIFEHRNYLPSLFLFLPVAAGLIKLFAYAKQRSHVTRYVLAGFMVLLIIVIGSGTYIRNRSWATEISLWQDAMRKAPQSARPLTNLAWQMAYGPHASPDQYDKALKLYQKALSLQKSRSHLNAVIMNNMAGIYFRKGEYPQAIHWLENALSVSPEYTRGRSDLIRILITAGHWDTASEHVDNLLLDNPDHAEYLNLKGLILLHQKRFEEAVEFFQKSLYLAPRSKTALIGLGVAHSSSGDYRRAEMALRKAHQIAPESMTALFGLIENSLRAGDGLQTREYTGQLLKIHHMTAIKDRLNNLADDPFEPPLSPELILQTIESRAVENAKKIIGIQH